MEKSINMECEICGKPVNKHNPIRAKIEGSVMVVCSECAKLGKIQKAQSKPKFTQRKKNKPSTPSKTQKYSNKDEPTEKLIEGFEDKIRNAREMFFTAFADDEPCIFTTGPLTLSIGAPPYSE